MLYFLFKYIFKHNLLLLEKLDFQQSQLLSWVSRDPSEIILICWFGDQEIFQIIINAANSCAA